MLLNKSLSTLQFLMSFRVKGDPYYPINNKKNVNLFKKYQKLIKKLENKNIYFEGRLASYRYLNMDEVIEAALKLFERLKYKYSKNG